MKNCLAFVFWPMVLIWTNVRMDITMVMAAMPSMVSMVMHESMEIVTDIVRTKNKYTFFHSIS